MGEYELPRRINWLSRALLVTGSLVFFYAAGLLYTPMQSQPWQFYACAGFAAFLLLVSVLAPVRYRAFLVNWL